MEDESCICSWLWLTDQENKHRSGRIYYRTHGWFNTRLCGKQSILTHFIINWSHAGLGFHNSILIHKLWFDSIWLFLDIYIRYSTRQYIFSTFTRVSWCYITITLKVKMSWFVYKRLHYVFTIIKLQFHHYISTLIQWLS